MTKNHTYKLYRSGDKYSDRVSEILKSANIRFSEIYVSTFDIAPMLITPRGSKVGLDEIAYFVNNRKVRTKQRNLAA